MRQYRILYYCRGSLRFAALVFNRDCGNQTYSAQNHG